LSLDPRVTALVLIDLRRGIVGRQLAPHAAADVVRNGARLADALRAKGGLVIFVRVMVGEVLNLPVDAPTPRPANIPAEASELHVQAGDVVISKRQWGAFYGTDLDQQLRRRSIRTIVMGGIATNFGVESTARAAQDRGYELVFAEDAMSSISADAHGFAINNIFRAWGGFARRSRCWLRLVPLQGDDDLAHLLVGLEILVGLYGIGKGEGSRDFDLEAAVGDAIEDVFAGGAGEIGVGVDFAQCVTAHGELLVQRDDKWEGGGLERE
jgi:nicotinamidase-related amidase